MSKVIMFELPNCPYCQKARRSILELQKESTNYQKIEITFIDENLNSQLANSYDYYYVPCFFVDSKKLLEGKVSKEQIKNLFDTLI